MNKDEILALIYKCDAIISNYLNDNSFDATKVTEAKLKQWKLQIDEDCAEVEQDDDLTAEQLSKFQSRYEGFLKLLNSFKKVSEDTKKDDTSKEETTVTKDDVISLMTECKNEAENLLENNDIKLRRSDKKWLKTTLSDIGLDYMNLANLDDDDEALKDYEEKYTQVAKDIADIKEEVKNRHKVKSITKAKDVAPATEESRIKLLKEILLGIGVAIGGVALAWLIIAFVRDIKKPVAKPTEPEPSDSYEEQIVEVSDALIAQNIDINDYTSLYNYACDIQKKLPAEMGITIDDIMYALKLANYDKLTDNGCFSDRDEVCASTYRIGQLAPVVGVDALVQRDPADDITITDEQMIDIIMTSTDSALSVAEFAEAKVDGGYDMYRAAEICLKGLYQTADEERAFLFAKVMNELTCREAVNYSICPNSPVCTHYTMAGMYTANQDRILELTSAKNLGPIYGSDARIDGTYGSMCVEELAAFMYIDTKNGTFIGNEKNCIYSFVIDENITCNYSLGR